MEEIEKNEEVKNRLVDVANIYEDIDTSDFQGILMAIEMMFDISYQDLFNYVAKIIINRRVENMKNETMDFSSRVDYLKMLEREFDCNIDYIDYSIDFLYK